MILLDSDVVIDILRGYPPALSWLDAQEGLEIGLPGFVIMELLQGCRNLDEQQELERETKRYQIVWPSPEACGKALATFAHHRLSLGLTMLDALIGHTAVGEGQTLQTFNQRRYRVIRELATVRPYAKQTEART
jgi:predicted nucleic acid-binding protein